MRTFEDTLLKFKHLSLLISTTGSAPAGVLCSISPGPVDFGDINSIVVVGNSVIPTIRSDVDSTIQSDVSFSEALAAMKRGYWVLRGKYPKVFYSLECRHASTERDMFVAHSRGVDIEIEMITEQLLATDWYILAARKEQSSSDKE